MEIVNIIQHQINHNAMGGCGIMAQHARGDSFIEIATSICSTKDNYKKKTAVLMLSKAFDEGRVIRLPVPNEYRNKMTHKVLRQMILDLFFV